MTTRTRLTLLFVCVVAAHSAQQAAPADEPAQQQAEPFRGALLSADQVSPSRLSALQAAGIQAIALQLRGDPDSRITERQACERIQQSNLALYYWIEVARCPELADAQPAWMASLQGHSEWRRLFESPPTPRDDEVVKTYPWVPILNEEPFQGQLRRVQKLLEDRPQPKGVFLNDLQGSPSACGCGNHFCRWTADYGKIRTATPLNNDAPAAFVAAVEKLLPQSTVVPVWTTECEEHDGAKDGLCAGVGCFKGICWKAYTQQLMPVAKRSPMLGVLLTYREFQRDLPIYGQQAGWITHAVKSFQTMPAIHDGDPIPSSRLIAVLQGWDVTDEQVASQIDVASSAGVAGYLVAYAKIEQDWQPRILKWK
ncbi:MAG: hypothetical protein O3C40_15945 [Planctomycetota bacterium]|nr:hypothetical protein [Planctomycetota bacterium]